LEGKGEKSGGPSFFCPQRPPPAMRASLDFLILRNCLPSVDATIVSYEVKKMPDSEDLAASAALKRSHSAVEDNDNGE
jgi:hypothetical protein